MSTSKPRCAGCGLLFLGAERPEFYDRQGRAYCCWNCAHPPRHSSRVRSWLLLVALVGGALALLALANWLTGRPIL
jgi:hypothetical protein